MSTTSTSTTGAVSTTLTLPFIPGMEGAGTVSAVGDGVEGFGIGDRVGWTDVRGSYAERHADPGRSGGADPGRPRLEDGGRRPAPGSHRPLPGHRYVPAPPATKCLIHAGAGGVGLLLTQIAKMLGAEVFTTVGTSDKAELSREAGSDHVIVYTRDRLQGAGRGDRRAQAARRGLRRSRRRHVHEAASICSGPGG